eukprot:COSAG06_NODE_1108_length_10655_cov_33.558450_12_plen_63_part_00
MAVTGPLRSQYYSVMYCTRVGNRRTGRGGTFNERSCLAHHGVAVHRRCAVVWSNIIAESDIT